MSDGIASRGGFVGVDLHLHRSVIARIDSRGREVECTRIDNSPQALVAEVEKAGAGVPVAIEATYGWYWAVDALQAAGFEVHLAHPYGLKQLRKRRRAKTDRVDALELARLLRLGSLPEAYIAPPELRELRELVRHRRQLTKVATRRRPGSGRGWPSTASGWRSANWTRSPAPTCSTRWIFLATTPIGWPHSAG